MVHEKCLQRNRCRVSSSVFIGICSRGVVSIHSVNASTGGMDTGATDAVNGKAFLATNRSEVTTFCERVN